MLASVEAVKLVYTRAPASSTATESAKTRRNFRFLEGSIYIDYDERRAGDLHNESPPFGLHDLNAPSPLQHSSPPSRRPACLPAGASGRRRRSRRSRSSSPKYSGWEIRDGAAAPAQPQPPPPDESEEGSEGANPNRVRTQQIREDGAFRKTRVPSVFDATVAPKLFGGQVKVYRLRFVAPKTKRFKWLLRFEQARRRTTVVLNGRRLGVNIDPYTPVRDRGEGPASPAR